VTRVLIIFSLTYCVIHSTLYYSAHSAQKITVARAKRLTGTYILVPQQSSLYYHIHNHGLIKLHAI